MAETDEKHVYHSGDRPKENIIFHGAPGKDAIATMQMFNMTNQQICFKVRSNEADFMSITPVATAILMPDEKIVVQLSLSPSFDRSKKTAVVVLRAIYEPPDNKLSPDEIWKARPPKDDISDCSFKVVVDESPESDKKPDHLTTMFLKRAADTYPTMVTHVAMTSAEKTMDTLPRVKGKLAKTPNVFSTELFTWLQGHPSEIRYPIYCLMLLSALIGFVMGAIVAWR